jgi:hypothetical protein
MISDSAGEVPSGRVTKPAPRWRPVCSGGVGGSGDAGLIGSSSTARVGVWAALPRSDCEILEERRVGGAGGDVGGGRGEEFRRRDAT